MINPDGGTAFPTDNARYTDTFGTTLKHCSTGMSLRDWFAGMALQGVAAQLLINDKDTGNFRNIDGGECRNQWEVMQTAAKIAYCLADAMIKAKEEKC